MRYISFVVCVALLSPSVASAESGFNFGVNGAPIISGSLLASQDGSGLKSIKPTGYFLGGQVGYTYELNRLLLGVEADYQFVSASGTGTHLACPAAKCKINITETDTVRVNHVGSVRGKIGYTLGTITPYITAGYAFGSAKVHASFGGLLPEVNQHFNPNGPALGAGIEYRLAANLFVRGEYDYLDLKDGPNQLRANVFRIGFDYAL